MGLPAWFRLGAGLQVIISYVTVFLGIYLMILGIKALKKYLRS